MHEGDNPSSTEPLSPSSPAWSGKVAERVARSQHDFVRKSISESESRTITVIAKSEHRLRTTMAEVEQNLRRDFAQQLQSKTSGQDADGHAGAGFDEAALLTRVQQMIQQAIQQSEGRLRAEMHREVQLAVDSAIATATVDSGVHMMPKKVRGGPKYAASDPGELDTTPVGSGEDVVESRRKNLQFNEDAEELEAASFSTGGQGKSIRARVNTGFVKPSGDERRGLQFNDEAEELEAASESTGGSKSVRARVNTGFVRESDVPKEARRGLQFQDEDEEMDAASQSTGSTGKSVKTRVNTGFVREPSAPKGLQSSEESEERGSKSRKELQFNDKAEEVEAASEATGGSGKSVRARVNTGFIRDTGLPKQEESRGLQFQEEVEELEAASHATGSSGKSVRTRINTGFVKQSDASKGVHLNEESEEIATSSPRKGLQFNDEAEELEAASQATGGSGKSVRARVNTGFVRDTDVPKENRGLQFQEEAEEFEAASHSTGGSGKSVRTRINTGFVKDAPKGLQFNEESEEISTSKPRKGLQFNDKAEELEAASESTGGAKSVRARVNTGFVRESDMPKEPRKGLQFQDEAEELDAASQSTGSAGKSVRARVNTGFVRDTTQEERTGLQFQEEVEELEAASHATGSSGKSVRSRVNTGFVKQSDAPKGVQLNEESEEIRASSPRKGLQFNDEAEELEAASQATGGSGKSVRARVNTGFVRDTDVPKEDKRGLQFQEEAEEFEAASHSTGGSGKSVRTRINTGFVKDAPKGLQFNEESEEVSSNKSRRELQFNDEAEELDAASESTGGAKSVRARVNTGFVRESDVPKEPRKGLQFQDEAEELDAASQSTGSTGKSVRTRVNTGFVREPSAPKGLQFSEESEEIATGKAHKELQFNDEAEEVEAASEATGGSGKSVRARVNTGFVRDTDVPKQEERKGLQFQLEAEELDAASEATGGSGKSVRARVNTGFVKSGDTPTEERKGLQFQDEVEELEAASESTGVAGKSVRTRINTGFVKQGDDQKGLQFNEESEELGASNARKGLQFDDKVEEVEAASESTDGAGKSVRTRINTGFVKAADVPKEDRRGLQFQDEAEEVEAASEASGGTKSVRARVNTGFAKVATTVEEDDEDENAQGGKSTVSLAEIGQLPAELDEMPPKGDAKQVKRQCSIRFSTHIESSDAASLMASSGARTLRSRVSTGFSTKNEVSSSEEDSDEDKALEDFGKDEEPPPDGRRGSRNSVGSSGSRGSLKKKLSLRRASRDIMHQRRSTVDKQVLEDVLAKRRQQAVTVGHMAAPTLTKGSPEGTIARHEVLDGDKDVELLTRSLKPLTLFEDIVEEDLLLLIEDSTKLYEYQDGEEVVRQGDSGGIHFFVVASGSFEIVKNGAVVPGLVLEKGSAFGESVLLIDGQRTATVRAKGKAQVYGMEADEVRDAIRERSEMQHKQVRSAMDKIMESERCEQFTNLNAFQLQKLYLESELKVFDSGEVIIQEGSALDDVYVLVQGGVILRKDGNDLQRIPRYSMFGMRGLLFGDVPWSAVADGSTKTLTLSRKLLEGLFTMERMPTVLMRSVISVAINALPELAHMDDEQREGLSNNFKVMAMVRGMGFDSQDVRFVMCLHGSIDVSSDGFSKDIQRCEGTKNDAVGVEQLLHASVPWKLQVRAANPMMPSFIAVWHKEAVDSMVKNEVKEKQRIMKNVFLFRTLSADQLMGLVDCMKTETVEADCPVFKQGDMGDSFYILGQGRVHIEANGRYIRALSTGDFFGDRALLNREPRSATISASERCTLWVITSKTFNEVMPPASIEYLKHRMTLQDAEYTFDDLQFVKVVGTGGFGVVKMVQTHKGVRYALKCVRKQPVVEFGQQESLINERSVLAGIDHPFVVRLVQSFRSDYFVYFLQELVSGGELLEALAKLNLLNQVQAQFYTASIILAFEHLHERRVAYLDLKSENVLLDAQGYIKIVDFGLATKIQGGHAHEVKGTPHFMAPEMILSKGYDTTADLWALGVCVYEFMIGNLPFANESTNKAEIFRTVLKAVITYPDDFKKKDYAEVSISLMEGLMQRNPSKRLGGGLEGYSELQNHDFFKGVDWDGLIARRVKPPYVPSRERYAEGIETRQSQCGKSLAAMEKQADAEERAKGWVDPDPGWDDDFC